MYFHDFYLSAQLRFYLKHVGVRRKTLCLLRRGLIGVFWGFQASFWDCFWPQNRAASESKLRLNFQLYLKWPCKQPWQVHAMALTWPPPPRNTVFCNFCFKSVKKRWVFEYFRKQRFWHPVYFLFLWFSFPLLRASEDAAGSNTLTRNRPRPYGSRI